MLGTFRSPGPSPAQPVEVHDRVREFSLLEHVGHLDRDRALPGAEQAGDEDRPGLTLHDRTPQAPQASGTDRTRLGSEGWRRVRGPARQARRPHADKRPALGPHPYVRWLRIAPRPVPPGATRP